MAPIITTSQLTATSVTVSWTQPQFSFTPVSYTVTLSQRTGQGDMLCTDLADVRDTMIAGESMEFTELEEFSIYDTQVRASFVELGQMVIRPGRIAITTLSAGME